MKLTKNFTLSEFTRSMTAARLGIDNTPKDHQVITALRITAEMLERIRAFLSERAGKEVPIHITSGYRCLELNTALRSSTTSDHVRGMAADWEAPAFGSPYKICAALSHFVDDLGIGQLINEFPDRDGWVHTGVPIPKNPINRIITIRADGTHVGIIR